ncbi:hypothetical protein HDU96_002142 [Phlyctochytrium bullatum]|nr:hypothetical protein HDU96_002142 [Phlyctochytrium bullatum]
MAPASNKAKLGVALGIFLPAVIAFGILAGIMASQNEIKLRRNDETTFDAAMDKVKKQFPNLPDAQTGPSRYQELLAIGWDANQSAVLVNKTFMLVRAIITGVDTVSSTYKGSAKLGLFGDMLGDDVNYKSIQPAATITLQLGPMSYPFDRYGNSLFPVAASFFNETSKANETLNVIFDIQLSTAGFRMAVDETAAKNQDTPSHSFFIAFTISRTLTTTMFSIFVMVLLWAIALLAYGFTSFVVAYGMKSEPPVIAYSVAMLFAIPNVRNTQPGSPPMGCTGDLIAFFWVMALVAISVCLLLYNLFYRTFIKKPEAATAPAAPAADSKPMSIAQPNADHLGAPQPQGGYMPLSSAPSSELHHRQPKTDVERSQYMLNQYEQQGLQKQQVAWDVAENRPISPPPRTKSALAMEEGHLDPFTSRRG